MTGLLKQPRYKWQPLREAFVYGPQPEPVIAEHMRFYNSTREEAIAALEKYDEGCTYWRNDIYQVQLRDCGDNVFHINIRRRDGGPIMTKP